MVGPSTGQSQPGFNEQGEEQLDSLKEVVPLDGEAKERR